MRQLLQRLLRARGGGATVRAYDFYPVGFHGDRYLIALVEYLLQRTQFFVETGSNVGSSLAHVARTAPDHVCYACEPDPTAFAHTVENTAAYPHVRLFQETSQQFLPRLLADETLLAGDVLFWLDAHDYGFEWPLREEVATITGHWPRAYILIDDFKVPGLDVFGYDQYRTQVCSYDYIAGSLDPRHDYRVYYPAYTERTSTHHPLRGWGLITFGYDEASEWPPTLQGRIRAA